MTFSTLALCLTALVAAPGGPSPSPTGLTSTRPAVTPLRDGAVDGPGDTRALFMEHCAKCHGEKGDGKGWTELDRQARSFLDGGFSYGNTRGAIVRSIRHGIPGTPMPAFPDEVLTAAQRDALADFAIALGPPGTVVEPGASVLRVEDRPAVVRGMLPALGEGDQRVPRGLLIGLPSGTTFEYRADDVQLRAVRQGEFVDRRDWGDRGGIELRPLGVVTLDARALAQHGVRRALRGTEIKGEAVLIRTALIDDASANVGALDETVRIAATAQGPVPVRTLALSVAPSARGEADALRAQLLAAPKDARLEAAFRGADGSVMHARRVTDGLFQVSRADGNGMTATFIHAPRWSQALERAALALEVAR
ncbi:MAG: cytochrome c [Planctomycetota bacterium]